MVVGLGCEKLTYDRVLPPEDITPENCLTLQDWKGHDAMMQAILDMADKKLQRLTKAVKYTSMADIWAEIEEGSHDKADKKTIVKDCMNRWKRNGKIK